MAQLAIRGHATRGKEVIGILEMLGGKNKTDSDGLKWFYGTNVDSYYTIEGDNYIHMRLNSRKGDILNLSLKSSLKSSLIRLWIRWSQENVNIAKLHLCNGMMKEGK